MEKNFRKQVGKRIKDLRKTKQITQEKFAELLGVSEKTVSYWECGHNAISFDKIPLIAEILGVPVYKLFVFVDFENDKESLQNLLSSATKTELHVLETVIEKILMLK